MKVEKIVKTTTNSKEYKRLTGYRVSGCPICAPHRGCNRRRNSANRSWKSYRKTKWKGDDHGI